MTILNPPSFGKSMAAIVFPAASTALMARLMSAAVKLTVAIAGAPDAVISDRTPAPAVPTL